MIIIFDLDDTLYSTSGRLDEATPNFSDMKLYEDAKYFFENCNNELSYEKSNSVTPAPKGHTGSRFARQGKPLFGARPRSGIGAGLISADHASRGQILKILVTHGEKEIQDKKINTLGIRKYFSEICICENRFDKLDCFKKILEKYQIKNPKEVFVVGDRIDSEIKYGNMLKMTTIFINRGKYADLKPKDEKEIPTLSVSSFREFYDNLDL